MNTATSFYLKQQARKRRNARTVPPIKPLRNNAEGRRVVHSIPQNLFDVLFICAVQSSPTMLWFQLIDFNRR